MALFKENKQLQTRKKWADLRPGEAFGLPEDLVEGLRSSTAQSLEDSRLLLLPLSVYTDAALSSQAGCTKRALSILRAMPLFAEVPLEQLEKIASESKERKAQSGEIVLRQGEHTRRLSIVLSGTVKLLRTTGQKLLVVDLLEAGDIFGDVAALRRTEVQYSVLCVSACVYLSVDRELVAGLEALQRGAKPYPNDPQLLQMLEERQRWKRFKRRVVSNAHRERQLSKVTWSSLLRSPSRDHKAERLPPISWRHHVSLI